LPTSLSFHSLAGLEPLTRDDGAVFYHCAVASSLPTFPFFSVTNVTLTAWGATTFSIKTFSINIITRRVVSTRSRF
jgi:hypothetical protein